jgi:tetratricopeptide (TPR) repeat protein
MALYNQGLAYYRLKCYNEATETLYHYINEYGMGDFQSPAGAVWANIVVEQGELTEATKERRAEARQHLEDLLVLERANPNDAEIKLDLGNLYYNQHDWELAGQKYFEAQALDAAMQEKEVIANRLRIDEEGRPYVKRPLEVNQDFINNNPLIVEDEYPYHERAVGDTGFRAERTYAVVTAKVTNRSDRILDDVEVEVWFMDAMQRPVDIAIRPIGTLGPGETRAFMARAIHYDDLYNIDDIEFFPRVRK